MERYSLIEELSRRFEMAATVNDKAQLLTSLILVLPTIEEDPPDWLKAFDRVAVAPKRRDITILLRSLRDAVPVSLRRSKSTGRSMPVVVEPGNPDAIPIAPQFLRTSFERAPDQFYADVANANGRLNEGVFDPSPGDFVRELAALGLRESGILEPSQEFNAHQAWPLVAGSLALQGTPGPIWFVVRRCSDLPQLETMLKKAARIGGGYFRNHLNEVSPGLDAIRRGRPAEKKGVFLCLANEVDARQKERAKLSSKVRGTSSSLRRLPPDLEAAVLECAKADLPVGPILFGLLDREGSCGEEARDYWPRILCNVADKHDDLAAILAVLRDSNAARASTSARKAFRFIDYLYHGPDVG